MNHEEGALAGLERIARERSDAGLAADIAEARTSAGLGQFTLAALGQFKRGKSTLLNALLKWTFFPMVALMVLGGTRRSRGTDSGSFAPPWTCGRRPFAEGPAHAQGRRDTLIYKGGTP